MILAISCSIPQTKKELEPYAIKKFKNETLKVSQTHKQAESILRNFAKKCIPAFIKIEKSGNLAAKQMPGTHFIKFRTEVVPAPEGTSMYIQKDIGSMLNAPEGGLYFVWVKFASGNLNLYWMDSFGFRGPEILTPLKSWFISKSQPCPNLEDDKDFDR